MKAWHDEGAEIDICAIGSKGAAFFNSYGGNVIAAVRGLGDKPEAEDLVGGVKVMLDNFAEAILISLFWSQRICEYHDAEAKVEQLLPLQAEESKNANTTGTISMSPMLKICWKVLLARYIESQVYQAVVENNACEQAARMIAMKSATDNAGELMDELQLIYNKARQAAITQELVRNC